ncbi:DNA protecting protein DprA [Noviherbaspirillum humi]|uniref:DNA protecting protein DprA n=1 Tax=Noviherbaspirillum humi TaxID=1688639 RepID=A0A239C8C3_9BURK|nr:DNA-processing protein DprA [Noviherbaspirillum humi]SNS16360.1 DNA protecting protein DprA [Noviherbaspirillum humi]
MASAERHQEIADWLRLEQTPGVGPATARKLLAAFGLPSNIFAADPVALRDVVPARVADALLEPVSDTTSALIDKTLTWAQAPGNHVLLLGDPAYPSSLLQTFDPPLVLYAKGRLALLTAPAIAVVGSRNATAQGMANAERFAEALSQSGLGIISGLALGIDAAAHRGGLKGAGGTVAVIGTGPDIVYPSRNHRLAHEIAAEGCLLSEYPLGTPAIAANFPRRNRIISGLSRGVLVVEAAAQSGSLITARLALEQGRDVFAIPGSIHSPLSKGCHLLIKQGAKLVESAQDVLEEIGALAAACRASTEDPDAGKPADDVMTSQVLQALGHDPAPVDVLAMRSGLDIASLSTALLHLEMENRVELLPNGNYRRIV